MRTIPRICNYNSVKQRCSLVLVIAIAVSFELRELATAFAVRATLVFWVQAGALLQPTTAVFDTHKRCRDKVAPPKLHHLLCIVYLAIFGLDDAVVRFGTAVTSVPIASTAILQGDV